jgi:hypothetical protein
MDSTTLDRLTQRLDRLERENRRWRLAGCLSVLGLVAVALMGQAMPGKAAKVVEAEEFVLRDAGGIERAALRMEAGSPWLELFDQGGKLRTFVAPSNIGLMDGPRVRLLLTLYEDQPLIQLYGDAGNLRAQLGIHKNGAVGLRLGGVGPGDVDLGVGADGSAELALTASRASALLTVAPRGASGTTMLSLGDEARRSRAIIAATQDKEPSVLLFDGGGKVSTFLSLTRVLVTGKDGRVWSAP